MISEVIVCSFYACRNVNRIKAMSNFVVTSRQNEQRKKRKEKESDTRDYRILKRVSIIVEYAFWEEKKTTARILSDLTQSILWAR